MARRRLRRAVVCSRSQARRLGGPRSSEFDTSSPFLLLFHLLLQQLLLLVLVLALPLLPRYPLLNLLLNALQLMRDVCADSPHIIIILPLPITNIDRLPPQQSNLALKRILPSDNASSARTFSTWVASED